MPTLEERVAYLEGRFEDHGDGLNRVDRRVTEVREDVGRLHEDIDHRFDGVDRRFEGVERRFDAIDRRFDAVDGRFIALDQKIDRHFTWLVGIQMATLVSVIGALVGSYYR